MVPTLGAVVADNAALIALVFGVLTGSLQVLVKTGLLLAVFASQRTLRHSGRLCALSHHVSLLTLIELNLKDGVIVFS